MLDPERDLKGAAPETLARALLRGGDVKTAQEAEEKDKTKSCTKP